jgi:hypothetical protein
MGRAAADAVAEHRARLESRPVFGKIADRAAVFAEPVPEAGLSFDAVLDLVREHILPFPMGNSHPRFYGFINATADPVGITADYLASAMNSNCWGGDHAAIHVEERVVRWLAELLGFPPDAEGILVSGGSMANFTALAAARRAVVAGNVREDGLFGGAPIAVYASDQVHSCDPHGSPRGSGGARPEGGPAPGDRRGQRRDRQHGCDRSARGARRFLPPRVALVSRGRRVRRDGGDFEGAGAALLRDGARRLDRRRSPQVALRSL